MKLLFKRDHYETEIVLDCKNCKILESNQEWTFLKVEDEVLNKISEIKRKINNTINRNSEFYRDCIRIVKHKQTFEESILVQTNGFTFTDQKYNIKLLVYRINLNKSSYGPVLKIIETEIVLSPATFVEDDNSDSETEIHGHFDHFKNSLKK